MITLQHTRNLYLYSYEGIEPETKENVRYAFGDLPPHYQVPATSELPVSFITALWLYSTKNRKKVTKWWLAMCFDKETGNYLG